MTKSKVDYTPYSYLLVHYTVLAWICLCAVVCCCVLKAFATSPQAVGSERRYEDDAATDQVQNDGGEVDDIEFVSLTNARPDVEVIEPVDDEYQQG